MTYSDMHNRLISDTIVFFEAHDLDEKEKWIEALESVILRHDKAKQVCS